MSRAGPAYPHCAHGRDPSRASEMIYDVKTQTLDSEDDIVNILIGTFVMTHRKRV